MAYMETYITVVTKIFINNIYDQLDGREMVAFFLSLLDLRFNRGTLHVCC